MGKGRGQGYVSAPPGRRSRVNKGKKSSSSGISTGITIVLIIMVAIYMFAFGGLEELQALFAPEDDDNTVLNVTDKNFDEISGRDGDYVQLGFLQEISDPAVEEAFLSAAARWSDIVEGSSYPVSGANFDAGESFCSSVDEGFVTAITLTTLVIVVSFDSLEPDGVLGRAGPCFVSSSPNARALTGQMTFDIEETPGLVADGSFESVVLHEMGHVLGIGSLWTNNNLIENEVFGTTTNLLLQPEFTGANGIAAYRDLINDQSEAFVPVEDGVFNGVEQFDRSEGEGSGSIDSHWDKDFFQGELMEFQIATGDVPPLSIVTIASLADFGYVVNTSLADSYTPPTQSFFRTVGNMLRGSKTYVSMEGDIDLSSMQVIET